MLPEISNNAKNYLNGIKPFIQQRLFNINTQTKVVSQTLFINKDNKLNIQERLDSDKISIAKSKSKPRKTISSVPPTNNNIKSVKEKVKYTDTPVRSKPTKKSGNKLNNRKMTKIQTPKAKKVVATQKRNVPKKSSNNKATKKINKVSNNRMSKTVDGKYY